jgi:hypothetical protein
LRTGFQHRKHLDQGLVFVFDGEKASEQPRTVGLKKVVEKISQTFGFGQIVFGQQIAGVELSQALKSFCGLKRLLSGDRC